MPAIVGRPRVERTIEGSDRTDGPRESIMGGILLLFCAVEPEVRLNSMQQRSVKARPQRRTVNAGRHAFSERSSFLTIRLTFYDPLIEV
jgi:hypothetical protein